MKVGLIFLRVFCRSVTFLLQAKDTDVGFIADSKLTGRIWHCATVSLVFPCVVLWWTGSFSGVRLIPHLMTGGIDCSPSATLEQTEAALVKGWMLWCRMPEGETFNFVVSQWINSFHLMFCFRYKIVVLGNVKSQNQAVGLVLYSVILAV